MSNMHRIVWLDANIRGSRFPDSRKLAQKFEISVRQAQRDIEYLKYTMGAPLEYSAEKKGYYYADKTFLLPAAVLSEEDKQLLTYLSNRYRSAGGTEVRRLADLFARLGGNSTDDNAAGIHLPILPCKPDEAECFNILSEANKERRRVRMSYEDHNGEATDRCFHTYKLFEKGGHAYATGFCELRAEIRTFRISRIRSLEPLEDTYTIPEYFYSADQQEQGFLFKVPYIALVEFEQSPDPSVFRLKTEPAGERLYSISYYSSGEILDALLLCRCSFRILSPNWLKEKLKQRLEIILQIHSSNDNICRTSPL